MKLFEFILRIQLLSCRIPSFPSVGGFSFRSICGILAFQKIIFKVFFLNLLFRLPSLGTLTRTRDLFIAFSPGQHFVHVELDLASQFIESPRLLYFNNLDFFSQPSKVLEVFGSLSSSSIAFRHSPEYGH